MSLAQRSELPFGVPRHWDCVKNAQGRRGADMFVSVRLVLQMEEFGISSRNESKPKRAAEIDGHRSKAPEAFFA